MADQTDMLNLIRAAAARGYCHPGNSAKEVDAYLLEAIVYEVCAALPAAPQPEAEPVAWHTDDNLEDRSATTWDKNVAERWKAKGWPVTPLYTHPATAPEAQEAEPESFQQRVRPWMLSCFGAEISGDRLERGDRLLEEVFELLQSGDYPKDRVAALTGYVWSRPAGEPAQEVGGVMVTLAAYCLAHGLNMHQAGETELARIWTKVEAIREKHKAKPTGSALPVALTPNTVHEEE